jgi:hypothetical protein
MNNLLTHDLILYYLISGTVCLITGYYLKSWFYPTVIETPNSPPTKSGYSIWMTLILIILCYVIYIQNGLIHLIPFIFSLYIFLSSNFLIIANPQSKELQGEKLDKETKNKLDQDFKNILGEEDKAKYPPDIEQINKEFSNSLQDIFNKFKILY